MKARKIISVLSMALILALTSLGLILQLAPTLVRADDFSPGRFDDPVPDPANCVSCSLREVIMKANANGVPDTIQLSAGTYVLTNDSGSGDETGDLDIDGDLTIIGAGAEQTIIDANGLSRVLDIYSGTVSISGVTISGGFYDGTSVSAAGVHVRIDGRLTLAQSIVTNNNGGGIFNRGYITVTGVSVIHNVTETSGGGIENFPYSGGIGKAYIYDSFIAYNEAGEIGGGIDNSLSAMMFISNTTILSNTADNYGGGVQAGTLTDLTIINSRILSNTTNSFGGGVNGSRLLTITGSIIQGNTSQDEGGGIWTNADSLLIEDSEIIHNQAPGDDRGGGIKIGSDVMGTIRNSTIAYNSAGAGGGIHSAARFLTIDNTYIHHNESRFPGGPIGPSRGGGGIYHRGGDMHIYNSEIAHNRALLSGGGIYRGAGDGSAPLLISNTLIHHNTSTEEGDSVAIGGGGVKVTVGSIIIENSQILSNTANDNGGGLNIYSIPMTVTNSLIAYNTSKTLGGGLYFNGVSSGIDAIISNSTFSHNHADENGGGVYQDYRRATMHISYSTIATNTVITDTGGGVAIDRGDVILTSTLIANNTHANCDGIAISGGHNLDSDGTCSLTATSDITNTEAHLGPLQDNGGDTLTHALLPASPALNGGDSTTCPATDQRSVARPQAGQCDIGAYETQLPPTVHNPIQPATGGTIQTANSEVLLTIPPEAVTETTTISITMLVQSNYPFAEFIPVQFPFEVLAQDSNGHQVTQFKKPITLTIRYEDEAWESTGISEEKMNLYYYNGAQWQPVLPCTNCQHNAASNSMVVQLDHLTEFALMLSPITTEFKYIYLPLVIK